MTPDNGHTRRWRAAFDAEAGQTTVEWLMVAGLLTAMTIFIGNLVVQAIGRYGVGLIYSVRMLAP
jgi:hypothetical protein